MVSRLEDLCGIQVAITHANELFRNKSLDLPVRALLQKRYKRNGDIWFEDMEKKVTESLLKIPWVVTDKIPTSLIVFCLVRSHEWVQFHKKKFHLTLDYCYKFLRSSFFSSNGLINKKMAARELVMDTKLSPSQRFCIACFYCFSDVIPTFWEEIPEVKSRKFKPNLGICGKNEMVVSWSRYMLGEPQNTLSLCKLALEDGNDISFKSNFEKLNEADRKEVIFLSRRQLEYFLNREYLQRLKVYDVFSFQLCLPFEPYIDMVLFLIRHLDENELKVFLQSKDMIYLVLYHLLSWPYQHLFMDIMNRIWEELSECGFFVFYVLLHKIEFLTRLQLSWKFWDYRRILRDFWTQSPLSFKKKFFSVESSKSEFSHLLDYTYGINRTYIIDDYVYNYNYSKFLIYKLFTSPLFTIEILHLILESASLEQKSSIAESQGKFILKYDLKRIDLFIECCVPKEGVESFKRRVVNCRDVKEYLWKFILGGKLNKFQKILDWALVGEEIIKYHQCLLELFLNSKVILFHSSNELKYIDKSLKWSLSSVEIKEIKKSLVSSVKDILKWYKDSLLEGNFKKIDIYLNWFSSEINIRKFKKDLIFETICHENFWYATDCLSISEKFVKWSAISQEELKDFKIQFTFLKTVIEYYSNFVAQMRLNETDEFIHWANLTKIQAKEFKKLLVFNSKRRVFFACVDFILNGETNFVKKLVDWTQLTKEKVREFCFMLLEKFDVYVMKNKWHEVEKLLNWCCTSQKEVSEFKRGIPLKMNGVWLNLILYKRFDDIDRFFTWTCIHNSLKKRLLKGIIFNELIYQVIAAEFMENKNDEIETIKWFSDNDLLLNKFKESFLNWCHEKKGIRTCLYPDCFKGLSLHCKRYSLDSKRYCLDTKDITKFSQRIDEHNRSKAKLKRNLEPFLNSNIRKTKRSRHC